jgi:hypothetical protein
MEVISFAPSKTLSRGFPWDYTFKLIPIGDLHVGSDGCNLEALDRTIRKGVADGCWFIGMGDFLDFMSSSNRQRQMEAGLYDTARTIIDDAAYQLVEKVKAVLKPSVGRWLGLLEGNHYWVFDDGVTSDQYLCQYLNAPFLGTCGSVQVRFGNDHRKSITCEIFAHHGYGGGTTPGAILTKLMKAMMAFEADIYLMGHQHQLVTAKPDRLYNTHAVNPRSVARQRLLVGTGSFMAGYKQGSRYAGRPHGSYVEQRVLQPSAIGAPLITARPSSTAGFPRLELSVTS